MDDKQMDRLVDTVDEHTHDINDLKIKSNSLKSSIDRLTEKIDDMNKNFSKLTDAVESLKLEPAKKYQDITKRLVIGFVTAGVVYAICYLLGYVVTK